MDRARPQRRLRRGDRPARGPGAVTGGWLRLAEPVDVDAPVLAAYSDAWVPAVFSRTREPNPVPSLDLTVHYRTPLPHRAARRGDWVLVEFRTTTLRDGFLEEDGRVWATDGTLLALSRQLALSLPQGASTPSASRTNASTSASSRQRS